MNTNTQTTRLYHSPLSPFCRKVRLVPAEKRIEVDLVEERYWESPPDLKRRNPDWGPRRVEDLAELAAAHALALAEVRAMPANNLMLLFRKGGGQA